MASTILLFLYLNTLYLTCCDASGSGVTNPSTNSTSDDDVTETQLASCKIVTEELVASARATVTRVLTGACNARKMDEKLQALEKNLNRELEEIKTLLYAILENKKYQKSYSVYHEDYPIMRLSPRQTEIDEFNNTIQRVSSLNGSSSSLFFYYWQIKRFDEKLDSWKTARSVRSSTFYVGQNGYAMYIKVTPRYFPDGTVFISVGLTRGRQDSVLEWPFPHQIRLEVLDHSSEEPRQDRRSRIWDPSTLCSEYFWGRPKLTGEPDNPECVGLSVSRKVLFSEPMSSLDRPPRNTRYLWDGTIVIKLTVYL
ncbi:TNF receptor-associated factor 6-like isoform X2 [Ceratina calcarata]|uniref:TNF receptor-associated factor 6-like isoform X2 n=1 Tax=Ceratina calcarata TaxID=156304 RepID=A0AAJ7JCH2_9HYME|nr:TNF receptor-associated factor 6-like isoform X2 [Ceratina calcarata]